MPKNQLKINEKNASVAPQLKGHIDDLARLDYIYSIIPEKPAPSPRLGEKGKVIAYPNSATDRGDGFHVRYIYYEGSQMFTVLAAGQKRRQFQANALNAREYIALHHGDGYTGAAEQSNLEAADELSMDDLSEEYQ